jgi:tRNA threonylcarbamoyladenosine biosynthesis protein TsaE
MVVSCKVDDTGCEILLGSESDTVRAGRILGEVSQGVGIIYLRGNLGTGKTTLCRGILRQMSHTGAVKSPQCLCLVEWPENGNGYLPKPDLLIKLAIYKRGRIMRLCAGSTLGEAMSARLIRDLPIKGSDLN